MQREREIGKESYPKRRRNRQIEEGVVFPRGQG
jgi:hypothetical protein